MTVPKKNWALVGPVVLMLAFSGCAHARRSRVVYIQVSPPNAVVEVATASPGAGYYWISGHYRWDGRNYLWAGGHFQRAPRGRSAWMAGSWQPSQHGWYWVEGHWS